MKWLLLGGVALFCAGCFASWKSSRDSEIKVYRVPKENLTVEMPGELRR